MIIIKVYPKNKEYFIKVKKLAKEIIEICRKSGAEPVAYGGLVYFGYTQDKNAAVHDIDLLIPEKCIGKVAEILKDRKIKYLWNHKRHDFKIYKKGAKVELDAIEEYRGKGKLNEFDFNGLKVKAVSLDSLISTYKDACKESHGKHKQHVKRYEMLRKHNL
jgi:hypothetical protein